MSTFTAPENGWYVLDPSAEGGARKIPDGGWAEGIEWCMDSPSSQVVEFDATPLKVRWRHP